MTIEELISDTLYERRLARHGCFVSNAAGGELLKAGPEALPAIEKAIREVIEPALKVAPPPMDSVFRMGNSVPGAAHVLGAYLVVGLTHDPHRVVHFLRGVAESVLAKAIATSPSFLKLDVVGDATAITPPESFIAFLVEQASNSSDPIQKAATRALSFIRTGRAPP